MARLGGMGYTEAMGMPLPEFIGFYEEAVRQLEEEAKAVKG